jgi:hypothetical protein
MSVIASLLAIALLGKLAVPKRLPAQVLIALRAKLGCKLAGGFKIHKIYFRVGNIFPALVATSHL